MFIGAIRTLVGIINMIKADDTGTTVTLSASMDFKNNSTAAKEYYYDLNGNLTQDLNKGITGITYNFLNLPQSVVISNTLGQATNTYTYAADGRKLRANIGSKQTDYVGNVIYEGGALKRILVDGGYIEGGAYYFYLTDHLGNNRVVANASGGIVQTNHYYPFGMSFAEGVTTSGQPYKYNGKELDTERGLNLYDYSARLMDPALGRFSTVDPSAEKYYGISPYVYVGNNPLRLIDPDGREIWISYKDDEDNQRRIQYTQGTDYRGSNTFVQNTFSYLNAINDNGGSDMLSVLSSSKNSFDFVNQPTTDKKGNVVDGALNFDGNKSGGGTIYAGALMGNTSEYFKIESTSHELFHGLQQEEGQGGASVYNEVEANVYSSNITMNWSYKTNYIGGMSGNGLGNSTPAGVMYQQSFSNLTNGFSNSDFVNAIKSFKGGSEKNSTGLYNTYPLRRSNQVESILQQFYPMKR
ncbi:RHS repeat-associated core domain-containing protein [uncultured Bacteroides sp.]|uniref:RHS repeat domain-containing protein n=1 Tax=uncultured Bacteroides sp. TaxID=162156 RepID=UPI002AA66753|nr:RHS repeat-associated core domain-containing protein [uncultured Bacteroides sp.]